MKKTFGLIGFPLSHSFSKRYFTEKFISQGTSDSFEYLNFELSDLSEFPQLLSQHPTLAGLNVTIPYKEKIIPFLDELKNHAIPVGAVNTILVARDSEGNITHTEGFNTDVTGFYNTLKPLLKANHSGALVLGTGGASKAVVYALKMLQIPYLIVSRTRLHHTITYEDVSSELLQKYPVIVNTTPLGTFPDVHTFPPIPYEKLEGSNLLYDLVYNPAESQFLKKGIHHGAQAVNGHAMLVAQAEAAWKIWNPIG